MEFYQRTLYAYSLLKGEFNIHELEVRNIQKGYCYKGKFYPDDYLCSTYFKSKDGKNHFFGNISKEHLNKLNFDNNEYYVVLEERNDELAKEIMLGGLQEKRKAEIQKLETKIQKYDACIKYIEDGFDKYEQEIEDLDR